MREISAKLDYLEYDYANSAPVSPVKCLLFCLNVKLLQPMRHSLLKEVWLDEIVLPDFLTSNHVIITLCMK